MVEKARGSMIILLFIMIFQSTTTSVNISSLQEGGYACRHDKEFAPSIEVINYHFYNKFNFFNKTPMHRF